MDIKAARRFSERTNVSVLKRIGGTNQLNNHAICKYWLAGRCTRNPCRLMHSDLVPPQPKQSNSTWKNANCHGSKTTQAGGKIAQVTIQKLHTEASKTTVQKLHKSAVVGDEATASGHKTIQKAQQKLCKYWVTGNCVHGDKCADQHSWFVGDGFSLLTRLEGHTKAVTGIALPHGSDKLYSGSKDCSVRVWDCNTGKCASVVDLKAECGALIGEGPWVFVGVPNSVKAWNL